MCPQPGVDTKNSILKLRLPEILKKRIMHLSNEKNKSASELTRLLWNDYFRKTDERAWKEEVSEWKTTPSNYRTQK